MFPFVNEAVNEVYVVIATDYRAAWLRQDHHNPIDYWGYDL